MENLTKKKIKYIKSNWKNLSIEQMARNLKVSEEPIRRIVANFNKSTTIQEKMVKPKSDLKNFDEPYLIEKIDYIIFLLLLAVSLGLYTYTMSPGIAAGDCGELTCAVYFIAPAHSPGYPLYVLIGKLFMNLFIFIGRPVYRLTFFSAFGAAITVSVLYLFLVKLVGRLYSNDEIKNSELRKWLIRVPSVIAALLMMFSDELWAQAVIAEVYTLNSLFCPILLLVLIKWQERYIENGEAKSLNFEDLYWNKQIKLIYLFVFILGIALGNHHIILGYIIPCVLFFLYYLVDRKTFLISSIIIFIAYLLLLFKLMGYDIDPKFFVAILTCAAGIVIISNNNKLLIIGIISAVFLALSALVYLSPVIRSMSNPPLDWGDPEKIQNLIAIITRKQYMGLGQTSWSIGYFGNQLLVWLNWKFHQWTYFIVPFVFLGLFQLYRRDKIIFKFTLSFIFFYDISFLFFNKFQFTPRDEFFSRVFWIPSYIIMAIWIAYGFFYVYESIIKLFLIKERNNLLITTALALGLIVVPPAIQNWDPNFLRNNYANDNYGRNMLKTVEKNSYILTEGGDNQVFSLLYHTYVEHLRPDIDVYDQKGNVFVRLYGDLSRINSKELFKRNVESDHHLMLKKDTPKEVYENFPYWWLHDSTSYGEGGIKAVKRFRPGRPVYYTWRDNRRLKAINDKYNENREYRQTGILYRICEIGKPFIHPIAYWDYYDFYWQYNQDEAVNWDYLAREILANYNFIIADYHLNRTREIRVAWQNRNLSYDELTKGRSIILHQIMPDEFNEIKKLSKADVENMILNEEKLGFEFYRSSERFGYDMAAIHFNLGIYYINYGMKYLRERNTDDAIALLNLAEECFIRTTLVDQYQVRSYLQLGSINERKAMILGPSKETEYLKKAERAYQTGIAMNNKVKGLNEGLKKVRNLLKYPESKIKELEKLLEINPNVNANYKQLILAYQARGRIHEALSVAKRAIKKYPNDNNMIIDMANLNYYIKNFPEAIKYYKRLSKSSPNDPSLYNRIGELAEALKRYDEAYNNYKRALDIANRNPQFKSIGQAANNAIKRIEALQ